MLGLFIEQVLHMGPVESHSLPQYTAHCNSMDTTVVRIYGNDKPCHKTHSIHGR